MKTLFTFLFALVTITTFAQKEFQGKATYMSKTTLDMSSWGRKGQMSDAQKRQIAARMKSMLEKTYILTFNKTSSLYKEDEKLDAPNSGGMGFMKMMGGSGVKYKNIKDLVALESNEFFGKKFLISDKMEKPKWELGSETKQIGNYTCFKATLMKDVDPTDWTKMRRRSPKKDAKKGEKSKKDSSSVVKVSEEIEMPKQIEITAWYTPQIPVSNGPEDYWGLPGLILEINSGRTTILCTEVVINTSEKKEIEKPTKGKEITREDYVKTVTKKMEEMRNNFRSRGRRGKSRF